MSPGVIDKAIQSHSACLQHRNDARARFRIQCIHCENELPKIGAPTTSTQNKAEQYFVNITRWDEVLRKLSPHTPGKLVYPWSFLHLFHLIKPATQKNGGRNQDLNG